MRKKILKTLIAASASIMLAAPLAMVEPVAITAYADELTDTQESQAYVENVNINQDYDLQVSVSAYGRYAKVYVNDKLWDTIESYSDGYYDEETGEYVYNNDYFSGTSYLGNIVYGKTYNIKVIAYDNKDVASTPVTKTFKKDWPKVNSTGTYTTSSSNNMFERYTGYGMRGIEYYVQYSDGTYKEIEVYRATKKNGTYKKIATTTAWENLWFYDYDIEAGKTYYYKSRIKVKDGNNTVYGSYSKIVSDKYEKSQCSCYVNLDEKKHPVITVDTRGDATFYEFYKSTKPNKGFKKVATNTTGEFVDKKAKDGETYYYKVKPIYYNQKTGKSEAGVISRKPAGVKLIATPLNATYKYTSASSATVSWDKVKGFSKYEIYMKTDITGDVYKKIGTTSKNSFKISKLSKLNNYYVYIKGVKSGNTTSFISDSVSLYVSDLRPCNVESKVISATVGKTSATVKYKIKWDYVPAAKKIEIRAYDNKLGKSVTLKTFKSNKAGSYVYTKVIDSNGSSKYSDVQVVGVYGEDYASTYVSTWNDNTLKKVTGIKVSKKSETVDKITWKKVSNANYYNINIYRQDGMSVRSYSADKNYIEVDSLTPGVKYKYTVSAVNNKYGLYGESGEKMYAHSAKTTKITDINKNWDNSVNVVFENIKCAKSYKIMRATSSKGKYTEVGTFKVDDNASKWSDTYSFTDKKVTKGKTYYYKVVPTVVNDLGQKQKTSDSAVKSIKVTQ